MLRSSVLGLAILAGNDVLGHVPAAISLEPGDWLGDDGNWSSIRLQVGQPPQPVNLLLSTSLSEIRVVEESGCYQYDIHCVERRGGVFSSGASQTWQALGPWDNSLDRLGIQGNADYGLDTTLSFDPIRNASFDMTDVLVAAGNTTDYFTGFWGLSIVSSSFGNHQHEPSPLVQAVSNFAWIPSYSYGYTAGAYYKNMPASVTLGGYDSSRFEPQPVEFILSSDTLMPFVRVRGIQVSASTQAPILWTSNTDVLSTINTSFEAMIDSTTPFLWLPDALCDRFAQAFNLTYNNTFDLYFLSDDQFDSFSRADFSFTFSLSSIDNADDLGSLVDTPGVINLTISSAAFAHVLNFPFKLPVMQYGAPGIPYFPLRRMTNATWPIIGRAFLQETYIINEFDRGVFSLHQALFPDTPSTLADITQIPQPPNSRLQPPPSQASHSAFTAGQMAGIAIGIAVGCAVVLIVLCYLCLRKPTNISPGKGQKDMGENEDTESSLAPTVSRTLVRRLISSITRLTRLWRETAHLTEDKLATGPTEIPNNEVLELLAHPRPLELEAAVIFELESDWPRCLVANGVKHGRVNLGGDFPTHPRRISVSRNRLYSASTKHDRNPGPVLRHRPSLSPLLQARTAEAPDVNLPSKLRRKGRFPVRPSPANAVGMAPSLSHLQLPAGVVAHHGATGPSTSNPLPSYLVPHILTNSSQAAQRGRGLETSRLLAPRSAVSHGLIWAGHPDRCPSELSRSQSTHSSADSFASDYTEAEKSRLASSLCVPESSPYLPPEAEVPDTARRRFSWEAI